MTPWALALVLCAAEEVPPADAPVDSPKTYVAPALEAEALHFGLLAFSNLVTNEPFARISLDSVKSHFDGRAGWTFDVDYFLTNQFGHPYQGALTYTAARSAGLSFLWSALYTFTASLTWELFFEIDPPSVNDQITTTMGGVFLGEVLHRTAAILYAGNTFEQVFAWLVDPMGTLNRWLLGCECDVDAAHQPSSFAMLSVGATASRLRDTNTGTVMSTEPVHPDFGVLLSEGPDARDRSPFSYFDLSAHVSTGSLPVAALHVRGLLVGVPYAQGHGVYGLFGQYDFAQPSVTRVSAVGAGGGTYLQARLSQNVFAQLTGLASAVPFGAAGSLGLDEELYRDYHIGPGAEALLELRLIHRNVGMVRAVAREWLVVGAYTPPTGFESMTYLTVEAVARLVWRVGLSVDLDAAWRAPNFQDATYNRNVRSVALRLSLVVFTDDVMGTD